MSAAAPPSVPPPPSRGRGIDDPRLHAAIRRAPPWFAAVLLHLAVVVLVIAPALFGGRAPDPEPFIIHIRVAEPSQGDGAPPGPKPGDAPLPEATPEPLPAAGPAQAPEAPPQGETPANAPPSDADASPDPGAVSAALAKLRQPSGVGGAAAPAARGGGVPTGSPGALGGLRSGVGRRAAVARSGGGTGSEDAVEAGLTWLARHQAADGRFAGHDFAQVCVGAAPCDGPGYITYDVGLTGLALAAFAGAGYGHREGAHARTVARAVAFLRERQDGDGFFFRREDLKDMYNHGCATFGLAELYACTGDADLREPLERAVRALLVAQQPGGGWTYSPAPADGPRNDVSITGFALQALVAAREGGVTVPESAFGRVLAFLRRQTAPETGWVRYADKGINDLREGLGILSVALLGRMLLGDNRDDAGFQLGLAHLAKAEPALEPGERPRALNKGHYPLYYGTCAAYLAGGAAWTRWNPAAASLLVAAQRATGCASGSWDPAGKWAVNGGRVYATAMSLLTLEVYYKYLPTFLTAEAPAVEVPSDPGAPGPPEAPADPAAARQRRLRELLDQAGKDGR